MTGGKVRRVISFLLAVSVAVLPLTVALSGCSVASPSQGGPSSGADSSLTRDSLEAAFSGALDQRLVLHWRIAGKTRRDPHLPAVEWSEEAWVDPAGRMKLVVQEPNDPQISVHKDGKVWRDIFLGGGERGASVSGRYGDGVSDITKPAEMLFKEHLFILDQDGAAVEIEVLEYLAPGLADFTVEVPTIDAALDMNLDDAAGFDDFDLYFLGNAFDGLLLRDIVYRLDAGGSPSGGPDERVWFAYEPEDGGHPYVSVRSRPQLSESESKAMIEEWRGTVRPVSGLPGARLCEVMQGTGVLRYAVVLDLGSSTVEVASESRERAVRAAKALRRVE